MKLAEFMMFLSLILYLLTIAPVKATGYKTFDNSNPRDPAFYKTGIAARALGAHINGIETFPFFAAAVPLAGHQNTSLESWLCGERCDFLHALVAPRLAGFCPGRHRVVSCELDRVPALVNTGGE
jgi:uncharacterized MAPEG superfamily protein